MKKGVWSHISGLVRISYPNPLGFTDIIEHIRFLVNEHSFSKYEYINIHIIEEDASHTLDPTAYKAVIVINGDLQDTGKVEARTLYDDFIRYIKTEMHIIQKSSTIIDNDRDGKRPSDYR